MAMDASDLMTMKMFEDKDEGTGFGSGMFLWVILIFLFFLAFSGNGLFGGLGGNRGAGVAAAVINDLSQVERDILTGNCATQKEVLENRFVNELAFANLGSQMQQCCCDLKTTIINDGQQTRDLIQNQYIEHLRTDLSDAKTAISNYNQNQYILSQLGNWYSNPAVNPYTCYGNSGCGCSSNRCCG